MRCINVIRNEMVFVDSLKKNKRDIVNFISEQAKNEGLISNIEAFKEKVFAREKEISTAVGNAVAIPHGKSDSVLEPFVAFMRTKESFIWDENSKEQVKLIFLIGVPSKDANKLHLKYIAEISRKLINDDFRNNLLNLTTKEEIFNLLESINKNVN